MEELASLQESAREIALERFRIIQPFLEQDRSLSVIARKRRDPVSHNPSMADSVSPLWFGDGQCYKTVTFVMSFTATLRTA
jgi:hypothetical protein